MPELPEVQTIVSDLQKILPGLKIGDVQTDWKKMFKNTSFENFRKEVIGEKILRIERKGKNILIHLSARQNNPRPPENDRAFSIRKTGPRRSRATGWKLKAGQQPNPARLKTTRKTALFI